MNYGTFGNSSFNLALLEVIQRLWQTKLKNTIFLETWLKAAKDIEIQAGLRSQLVDERRQLRLLGEEVKRLGGKLELSTSESLLNRTFFEAGKLDSDLKRLCAFHRGIKAFTLNRCGHLMPLVHEALANLLEQISNEEERHIRWADIRFARLLTRDEMRECNLLISRFDAQMAAAWEKPWRELSRAPMPKSS
jgi:hypothetical protein